MTQSNDLKEYPHNIIPLYEWVKTNYVLRHHYRLKGEPQSYWYCNVNIGGLHGTLEDIGVRKNRIRALIDFIKSMGLYGRGATSEEALAKYHLHVIYHFDKVNQFFFIDEDVRRSEESELEDIIDDLDEETNDG